MHSYAPNYLPRLQSYQRELLDRLELLVNIDSGTGQIEGINSIMLYLEHWLRDIGFAVELHPSDLYGKNLVARRQGQGGGCLRVLLIGHVDTVYPQGSVAIQPFHVRDGVAFGPGVIDMKSGVLQGIYTLQALVESGFEEYTDPILLLNNYDDFSPPRTLTSHATLSH